MKIKVAGSWVTIGSGGTGRYAALVPGSGTGTVTVTHGLNSTDVTVSVRRVVSYDGVPVGEVGIRWYPSNANDVVLDFDTYSRTASEFYVTVIA